MTPKQENTRLVKQHNRLRKRLGYTFMRSEWTPDGFGSADTVEADNKRLTALNKVYSESNNAEEANGKITELNL